MASNLYPDGSSNANWTRLKVVLPKRGANSAYKVRRRDIIGVLCHRVTDEGHEEYLVEWATTTQHLAHRTAPAPYSWHGLAELSDCLPLVQRYLGTIQHPDELFGRLKNGQSRKRANGSDDEASLPPSSRSSTPAKSVESLSCGDVINGNLKRENGVITMRPAIATLCTDMPIPTFAMRENAKTLDTRQAKFEIRSAFDRKLSTASAPLELINQYDGTRPPLDFVFINEYRYGRGVDPIPPATVVGCGAKKAAVGPESHTRLQCGPQMGQNIGCQYSRVCECLEFAAVDKPRLTEQEREMVERLEQMGEPLPEGLPKRFPYRKGGTLQAFYLDSRHPIYECNSRCRCGPDCKTRLVQKGRTIPFQIFKTKNRGWGLRSTDDIAKGTFIDTYRGEIITDSEAERREKSAVSGLKASYLYNLDKYIGDNGLASEDCYVVDGEYMGGPTRFINHSCDPNLRQYTVSYNKYDTRIYDIAFFAYKDIKAMEELTFDYLDKDDDDEEEEGDAESRDKHEEQQEPSSSQSGTQMRCLCGSDNCRGTLWM